MPETRRHAAIMFTDIVGYTALMGSDEDRAFDVLARNREIHIKLIEQFNGALIKEMGDGMLISFNLASDAVRCAIEIQKACQAQEIPLKIGIHEGEMVFAGSDVHGDGVNIASRIQSETQQGCINISGAVYRDVKNKHDIQTKFIKDKRFKNVDEPIKVYQVLCGDENYKQPPSKSDDVKRINKKPYYLLTGLVVVVLAVLIIWKIIPTKPEAELDKSIAVLPLNNLSGNEADLYIVDGVTEAILNKLQRIGELSVRSSTSTKQYRDKPKNITEIGRELKVNYILEGSFQKIGNKAKLIVQLIKTDTDEHIWSKEYQRDWSDIFAVQSEVAQKIANEIGAAISPKIKDRIEAKLTNNLEAYDYYLKAINFQYNDENDLDSILFYIQKAIQLDSAFAEAYLVLSDVIFLKGYYASDDKIWKDSALAIINKAIHIKPYLSEAYSRKAYIYKWLFNYEAVEENYRLALEFDPNNTAALEDLGRKEYLKGNLEKSANYYLKYYMITLSNPQYENNDYALVSFINDYYDTNEAIENLRRIHDANPDNNQAIIMLGFIALRMGKTQDAIEFEKLYENSLQLEYYYLAAHDFEKVKEIFTEKIKQNPNFGKDYTGPTTFHRYGFALVKLGETNSGNKILNEELNRLKDAMEKGKEVNRFGGKYYDIACILAAQGKKDEAIKYLTISKENQLNGSFFPIPYVLSDPMFENIKDDERFKKLINDELQREIDFKKIFRHKVDSLQMKSELAWMIYK